MRVRMMSIAVGTALLMGAVSGCSTKTAPGMPSPSSGDTTASASTSPAGDAPHVANPLDTTKYQADPCRTLTTAQVESLGTPGATPKPDIANNLGPSCDWFSPKSPIAVSVSFNTANKQGLNSLYIKKNELALFQELPPINGYPAVIYGQADLRPQGTCGVSVGVSDTLDFDTLVQGDPRTKDPCGIAQRAAAMVVDNIKGGA